MDVHRGTFVPSCMLNRFAAYIDFLIMHGLQPFFVFRHGGHWKGRGLGQFTFRGQCRVWPWSGCPAKPQLWFGSAQPWTCSTCSFWLFLTWQPWYIESTWRLIGFLCAGDECSTAKAPTSRQSWSGPRTSCEVHDNGLEETHLVHVWNRSSRLNMHVPACIWRKDLNINNMDNRFDKLMYFLCTAC